MINSLSAGWTAVTLALVATGTLSAAAPLDDAVAVWHMAAEKGLPSANGAITIHGDVRLGVALAGADRQFSLCRGGDGLAARFNGGYLVVGSASPPVRVTGKQMTMYIRLRDPEGRWNAPLLSTLKPDGSTVPWLSWSHVDPRMIGVREARRLSREPRAVEFTWRGGPLPTPRQATLRLSAPVDLIGPTAWHDVVVRFRGANLELFVDGVLMDEEWPHGPLADFHGPFVIGASINVSRPGPAFHGLVDHVALWGRALGGEEIAALSGGKEEVARRDLEILGPESPSVQYWRPRGYNAFVGDCMPFFHDGTFHFFYLFDRHHGTSKWGAGAHQFGHATSRDLVHWEHYPLALPITDQIECSLGTGNCVYHDGTYYLYYIQHGRRIPFADAPYVGDNIFVATSSDGIHFRKRPEPVVELRYRDADDINPHVFADASGRRFFMFITGRSYASDDLVHWQKTAELASMDRFKTGWWACSSYFKWNERYYFTSCGRFSMSATPVEAAHWSRRACATTSASRRWPRLPAVATSWWATSPSRSTPHAPSSANWCNTPTAHWGRGSCRK
jgi:hypothetical protein